MRKTDCSVHSLVSKIAQSPAQMLSPAATARFEAAKVLTNKQTDRFYDKAANRHGLIVGLGRICRPFYFHGRGERREDKLSEEHHPKACPTYCSSTPRK
jgi:hypothetical protein